LKRVLLILVGTLLGLGTMYVALAIFGLLAVWSPFPVSWWRAHPAIVRTCSEAVVVVPCVGALGYTFLKLFRTHAVANAFASMTAVLLLGLSGVITQSGGFLAGLRISWHLFVPFLIGPPFVAYLFLTMRTRDDELFRRRYDQRDSWLKRVGYFRKWFRRRSNNRWRGP